VKSTDKSYSQYFFHKLNFYGLKDSIAKESTAVPICVSRFQYFAISQRARPSRVAAEKKIVFPV
jgi:hypothetical protein